ncbi:MAG: HdeD family acid-resistance protein [Spirochaetaceae bacterium]
MIVFTTNRTLLTVSGAISALLGFVALIWPGITVQILAVVVGVFLLAEALLSLLVRRRGMVLTWSAVLQGLVGIVVALFLVVMPGTAVRVIVMIIAVWLVLRAIVQAAIAVQNRTVSGAALFMGMVAAISLLVGALLIFRPEAGVIAAAWLLGIYAIVTGALAILWGQKAARIPQHDVPERREASPEADATSPPPDDPAAPQESAPATTDETTTGESLSGENEEE